MSFLWFSRTPSRGIHPAEGKDPFEAEGVTRGARAPNDSVARIDVV